MQNSDNASKMIGNHLSHLFIACTIIMIWLSSLPTVSLSAQDLVIIPRRVVFEGSRKTEDITLANSGADTAKFIISLVQMRMKEDGSFEQITTPDPGQNFADKYLRFYPRTVVLPPKESQMIKMQLIKADKLDPGEYRSHIYFRAEPKATPLGTEIAAGDTSTTFSASLKAVFGITIPVIIRVGEATGQVTLSDLAVETVNDSVTKCKITFNRTGNTSVYGDISVYYVPPTGKAIQVANPKGIAVYTPNSIRRFDCKLENMPGVDYHKGKLQIIYSSELGTRPIKLAESEIVLK